MGKLVIRGKEDVRALFTKSRGNFASVLPAGIDADRLVQTAISAVLTTPKLMTCTPVSLLRSVMQAARLGLYCDGVLGHAWIIPYGKVAS